MIDPVLSLAFSMHSNKGVYAVLLGSGISRSAGIPTGWEVVLDLTHKLSLLYNENDGSNPEAWYRAKFGEEPNYAKLLNMLAKSPTERSQLLRAYFEPTEEERERGEKIPTAAHNAIANLVASGHIRVIVTTNFDRLMEKALESIDITPTIISTSDAVRGALPLSHMSNCIIKVHGDYLDTRIKNTPKELARYTPSMNQLLDRIFDEFGLIVCGWSADWDTALRAALERCQSRRFTTYWTTLTGKLGESAKHLIAQRRAEVISILGADFFFQTLEEKISALQEFDKPHPLSANVAVTSVKKYLEDDRYIIRLHDLVMQEINALYEQITSEKLFPIQGIPFTPEGLKLRLDHYESLSQISLAVIINGCYWSKQASQIDIWVKCLQRIANMPQAFGTGEWVSLRLYPALLLLYGGGIASLAAGRYEILAGLLIKAVVRERNKNQPLVLSLDPGEVLSQATGRKLPGTPALAHTPTSDHLYEVLQEPLKDFLAEESQYQRCFDRFEFLFSLVYADLDQKVNQHNRIWGPIGRFGWDRFYYEGLKELEAEATGAGENWPPLQAGLFDRSIDRFLALKTEIIKLIVQLGWNW